MKMYSNNHQLFYFIRNIIMFLEKYFEYFSLVTIVICLKIFQIIMVENKYKKLTVKNALEYLHNIRSINYPDTIFTNSKYSKM